MKLKKIIGISFLILGIIGFFYFANEKNEKSIFNERASSREKKEYQVELNKDQTYEIKFWGIDEEMTGVYTAPHFEAHIVIKNDQNQILFNQTLISITEIETGAKRVTHDGINYSHTPKTDETIHIEIEIKEGDYMDIDVYENLDSEADALPGMFIILALVGLVLYFRSRRKNE